MTGFWDEKYRGDPYLYGKEPNRFFLNHLPEREQGRLQPRILLPMEGEGRNAVFAAKKGWYVDAFDASKVAREKAWKLASHASVSINYTLQDVTRSLTLPDKTYDAVALIYAHLEPLYRKRLHRSVMKALAPGGLLILEAFHRSQSGNPSGGPGDPEKLYTAEMIRSDFPDLTFLQLDETITLLEEGAGHRGRASVVRALARKEL